MERKELRVCRGMIIEKFVAIEQLIAWLISWHYFNKEDRDFMLNFLGHNRLDFGFKKDMLFHLFKLKNQSLKDRLNKLCKIRNTFSHAPLINETTDSKDFYFREIDSDEPVNTNVDPKQKYEEFNLLWGEVYKELDQIGKDKGWPERWVVPDDLK